MRKTRETVVFLLTLTFGFVGRPGRVVAQPERSEEVSRAAAPAPASVGHAAGAASTSGKRLFLDEHDLGPGKVTAQAVAGAHRKDLATQHKHGVAFKAYWVDEKQGKVYCLAEAPSPGAINAVHKEAHGLVAGKIAEVSSDSASWTPAAGAKLFLDVHHFGPGKVTAEAVAGAHQKDLAAQGRHGVKYLNYWFEAGTGTVMCLTEARTAEDALAVHKEAHGLMPDAIDEVSEGR